MTLCKKCFPLFFSFIKSVAKIRSIVLTWALITLSSCVTYYQRNIKFNNAFSSGNISESERILAKDKKAPKRKDHLIYFMNRGTVCSLLEKYEESNNYFEEAYKLADSYHNNYINEGAAYLLNPNIIEYKGEDFELLFIHYYKAINYLKTNKLSEALVECRRMNIRLNIINDKYRNDKRFKRDAFIHNLMGIIYDVNQDYNNAFVAYRNSLEIYKQEYGDLFGIRIPGQLIHDFLKSAYKSGFLEELKFYEKELKVKYYPKEEPESEVVFFWENGLNPVKTEWGINFNIIRGAGGNISFYNNDLGLSFPFALNDDEYNKSGLSKIEFIRVAFPKYIERPNIFSTASITTSKKELILEKAEDINSIAFKSLQDRMFLELGKGLLRVAFKKAAEYGLRQENKDAGAMLGAFNALTEQADTRQWPTLPHSIYYTRIPMEQGKQDIKLTMKNNSNEQSKVVDLHFDIKKGNTYFYTYTTIDTYPIPY